MVNLEEVEEAIERYEKADTEWDTMQKLSWLYAVRNNLGVGYYTQEYPQYPPYSGASNTTVYGDINVNVNDSDFVKACDGLRADDIIPIMDELMEDMRVLYPKVYNSILMRLESLK